VRLAGGVRPVLDASRHDEKLAFRELDRAITQVDAERASDHEEELVLPFVPVPRERPFIFASRIS